MHAQNESQSPVTLIAIDDDPASLELISDTLEQADLQILTATDPRAGLDLVREKRPEIVLLDLLMPGVSGMELLEKILVMAPETEIFHRIGCRGHPEGSKRLHHQTSFGSCPSPQDRHTHPGRAATEVGRTFGFRAFASIRIRGHGWSKLSDAGCFFANPPGGAALPLRSRHG